MGISPFPFGDFAGGEGGADETVHRLSQTLNSSLSANTLLTLDVVIGEILPEGNPGDFTISDWDEKNETIEFPVVE